MCSTNRIVASRVKDHPAYLDTDEPPIVPLFEQAEVCDIVDRPVARQKVLGVVGRTLCVLNADRRGMRQQRPQTVGNRETFQLHVAIVVYHAYVWLRNLL